MTDASTQIHGLYQDLCNHALERARDIAGNVARLNRVLEAALEHAQSSMQDRTLDNMVALIRRMQSQGLLRSIGSIKPHHIAETLPGLVPSLVNRALSNHRIGESGRMLIPASTFYRSTAFHRYLEPARYGALTLLAGHRMRHEDWLASRQPGKYA
jgi:hypothetical protein